MEKKERPPAKTNAERMRALRERRAQAGITELRGVMLPMDLHAPAKRVLSDWLKGGSADWKPAELSRQKARTPDVAGKSNNHLTESEGKTYE